jgi:hypothetical protein
MFLKGASDYYYYKFLHPRARVAWLPGKCLKGVRSTLYPVGSKTLITPHGVISSCTCLGPQDHGDATRCPISPRKRGPCAQWNRELLIGSRPWPAMPSLVALQSHCVDAGLEIGSITGSRSGGLMRRQEHQCQTSYGTWGGYGPAGWRLLFVDAFGQMGMLVLLIGINGPGSPG